MFSEKSCKSKLDFIMDLPSWMHSPFQRSQNRVFGYYSLLTYILAFWCCGPDFVSTHQWQPPALRSFESVTPGVWEKKGWGEGLHVVDKLCIIHAYVKYIGRCTMVHGQKSLNRGTGHPFHNSNPQQFVFSPTTGRWPTTYSRWRAWTILELITCSCYMFNLLIHLCANTSISCFSNSRKLQDGCINWKISSICIRRNPYFKKKAIYKSGQIWGQPGSPQPPKCPSASHGAWLFEIHESAGWKTTRIDVFVCSHVFSFLKSVSFLKVSSLFFPRCVYFQQRHIHHAMQPRS